jgi:hydrogenase maturation protease
MQIKKYFNILLAGIGNSIRKDDGIGPYICKKIEKFKMQGLTTAIYHQLHTELVEEFLKYDYVIIADAAVEGEAVAFYPLTNEQINPVASSHHVNASLLVSLARQLYNKELHMMVCSVRGENFDMGESLSDAAKNNADQAVSIIINWVSAQNT